MSYSASSSLGLSTACYHDGDEHQEKEAEDEVGQEEAWKDVKAMVKYEGPERVIALNYASTRAAKMLWAAVFLQLNYALRVQRLEYNCVKITSQYVRYNQSKK
ncbi:hypothetical protein TRAPUB_581 [Trametes pubescens]|uniref:Uncharacterized protein n=1 Tax=Trametes pubescens TaxID=154538 RepID=A0A1M2VLQ2_TRAPU|nr:hypothetical protein TRAPUB_581 [Trametes pubescens]